jgi:hypothetical protein
LLSLDEKETHKNNDDTDQRLYLKVELLKMKPICFNYHSNILFISLCVAPVASCFSLMLVGYSENGTIYFAALIPFSFAKVLLSYEKLFFSLP